MSIEALTRDTEGPGTKRSKPRLGFLGVGLIGRNRLEAIARSGAAEIAAIADSSREFAELAAQAQPEAQIVSSLDDLLEVGVDGVVIATPSALHAGQAISAIERGKAVFCQKPLGRSAAETREVISAARKANVLVGVDLSYRFMHGIAKIHELCRGGELGDIFAIDLIFHNANGPDKAWFYDWTLSDGGCVIDLGIHLVDLALWNVGFPRVSGVTARLFSDGKPVRGRSVAVEDYAIARLDLENGATVRIACSWKLRAGCDAIISGTFSGTKGGAAFHNVEGSFYDFTAERYQGANRETLAGPPDAWDGRAAVDWTERLANGARFDPESEKLVPISETLDRIYESGTGKHLHRQ